MARSAMHRQRAGGKGRRPACRPWARNAPATGTGAPPRKPGARLDRFGLQLLVSAGSEGVAGSGRPRSQLGLYCCLFGFTPFQETCRQASLQARRRLGDGRQIPPGRVSLRQRGLHDRPGDKTRCHITATPRRQWRPGRNESRRNEQKKAKRKKRSQRCQMAKFSPPPGGENFCGRKLLQICYKDVKERN